MTEEKKPLGMTVKQQRVMEMIIGLLKETPPFRIRGAHAQLDMEEENRPSHSLVTATIQTLVDAEILELIEFEKIPGKKMKSALYEWHPEIFGTYEIITVKQKKRKTPEKKPKDAPVVALEVTPQDWYTAHIWEIKEMEAEYALLGAKLAKLKAEKAEADESIANVMKCYAHREGK